MKTIKYFLILFAFVFSMHGCMDLDVPPVNVITDEAIFSNEDGVKSFLARVYGAMPIEDFRFCHTRAPNHFYAINPFACLTGEALSRDVGGANTETHTYWGDAYIIFRDLHYFMETLPSYKEKAGYTDDQVNRWIGECYFIRAMTYFAMVKRYGGVPIVTKVLEFNGDDLEALDIPRASEEEVYNQVAADFDEAYKLLPATSHVSRANKYTAMGFKSRAMLYAGSIAKYNTSVLNDPNTKKRLCGIPIEKAQTYFKLAYDAAKLVEGRYSLYTKAWSATDRDAQYKNFVDMFFDASSSENIFVRQYGYPYSVHGYDCYNICLQYMTSTYAAETNPTLSFVEMFDGFPRRENGQIEVYDEKGYYKLYDNVYDFFANAEPRLRATVILPGDLFKGVALEVYRGIYKEPVGAGITRLLPVGSNEKYNAVSSVSSRIAMSTNAQSQTTVTDKTGKIFNAAGKSGVFNDQGVACLGGFGLRKYMNPNMPPELVVENRSDQSWIELRYGEVLLNRAEAAFELFLLGQGDQYKNDAYDCIVKIQERAGAIKTPSANDLTLDLVRKEIRKELAFENKTWWNLRRWRIINLEQNNTLFRTLMPFFVLNENKFFFDDRLDETNKRYTFDTRWYYKQIPQARITESPSLIQNLGY